MHHPTRWRDAGSELLASLRRMRLSETATMAPGEPQDVVAAGPEPSAGGWARVKQVFQAALECEPASRLAFVAEACAGDTALAEAVRGLLAAHDDARGFLESPAGVDQAAAAFFGQQGVQPPALHAGDRLGPYDVLGLIEIGGMGEVYRAHDTRLKRDVALKVLRAQPADAPVLLQRLEAEARAAAAISDPNVVAVFDVGSADGVPYVISELLDGETLGQRLAGQRLPWREAVAYGVQIAGGLRAAHARGVVHRDLKPDNVFLTRQGGLKLLDFGIAKLMQAEAAGPPPGGAEAAAGAARSTTMGTPGYVAPEQLDGRPIDHRADIFAFGAVLYRMLAGRSAFGDEATTADLGISLERPPRPFTPKDGVPPALERVVRRCLEKRPDDRFQSADDLRRALLALATPMAWVRRHGAALALSLAACIAAAVLVQRGWRGRVDGAAGGIHSLAILPFEDAAGSAERQFLDEGITDGLIAQVARTRGLRVIARASILRFKRGSARVPEIARQLGVDAVLDGDVQRLGERVRISVRLVRGATDTPVWSGTYERLARETPLLLREVAAGIGAATTHETSAATAPALPRSVEAYEAYLRGRHYWNLRSSETIPKAIEQFERALELDPLFAQAYSGLGDAFATLGDKGYSMPHKDAFARAQAAAQRALELDPAEAEAHATLGHMYMHAWRWMDAERELGRALELNPGYASAHQWQAFNLASLGRLDEALAAGRRAEELDPLSPSINLDLAQILFFAGRDAEAVAQCHKTLRANPGFGDARRVLFLILLHMHRDDDARREMEAFVQASAAPDASLGYGYARLGRRADALEVLAQLEHASDEQFVPPYNLALIHAALGDHERAFARLDEALSTQDPKSMILPVDPRLEGLRGDPRFAGLLARMGLPAR